MEVTSPSLNTCLIIVSWLVFIFNLKFCTERVKICPDAFIAILTKISLVKHHQFPRPILTKPIIVKNSQPVKGPNANNISILRPTRKNMANLCLLENTTRLYAELPIQTWLRWFGPRSWSEYWICCPKWYQSIGWSW